MKSAPSFPLSVLCLLMPPEWDPNGRPARMDAPADPTPQRRISPTTSRRLAGALLLGLGLAAMAVAASSDLTWLRWSAGVGAALVVGFAGALQDGRYAFLGGLRRVRRRVKKSRWKLDSQATRAAST